MNSDNTNALLALRRDIDEVDSQIVALLSERQRLVQRVAPLKNDSNAVRDPERVERVIARVRGLAEQTGASADIVERVYRAMIESFIDFELAEHRSLPEG